ncbi:GNAT family N-acetyltransferase [Chromobacterium piscinae]|uniref:GNAT family N-acetyltransferase n=1 Tax=Chromobacterium piscinae TaxID=686831 RepID=UPI001E48F159|nr:GNAT family N-acetyltransferase [Chromobacterium piscinae]MCD4504925.1 GNAT family N-acetyltransferase [Chromobacterium piscinae]
MITTRLATPADTAALAELFYRIDLHYFGHRRSNREASARYVARNLFQTHCGVSIMLAEQDGQAMGLASFSLLYPAPEYGGQLFMKDLFAIQEARGRGIGKALMQALARHALKTGCKRMDWTAERGNVDAIEFYRRIGAGIVEEKVYYRLTDETLKAFAA